MEPCGSQVNFDCGLNVLTLVFVRRGFQHLEDVLSALNFVSQDQGMNLRQHAVQVVVRMIRMKEDRIARAFFRMKLDEP